MPASLVCTFNVGERLARLIVVSEHVNAWHWSVSFGGEKYPFAEGVSETKVAAQVSAQLALEQWARHSPRDLEVALDYPWIEEIR